MACAWNCIAITVTVSVIPRPMNWSVSRSPAAAASTSSRICRPATTTPCSSSRPTYSVSPADQGSNDDADSDGTATTVRGLAATTTPITTLISGEIDLTWDQGFYQPASPVAAVGNYVWYDENNNGQQDEAAANGLNGVT